MTVQVGHTLNLTIDRMGMNGEGVGQLDAGRLAFVADGLPGEEVTATVTEIRKSFVRAVATARQRTSPARVTPPCPVYRECGGCALQHWNYAEELAYKEDRVRQALGRIAGIERPPVDPIRGADDPYGYRNKGQFPWGGNASEPTLGLYQRGSHRVVPVPSCAIQDALVNEVVAVAARTAQKHRLAPYDPATGTGVLRHLLVRSSRAEEASLALLVAAHCPPANVLQDFATDLLAAAPHLVGVGINLNPGNTNRVLGPQTLPLSGATHLFDHILGMRFRMSFTSFFQVNPRQVEVLYQLAMDGLGMVDEIWDLYAGVGTLAALAARRARRVRAVEVHPASIADAQENFRENGLTTVTIETGEAERVVARWAASGQAVPDAVIMDPPRSGLRPEMVDALLALAPSRLVYVSCNPDTWARDVAALSPRYRLQRAAPVDMFPRTDHVEVVSSMLLTGV